MMKILTLSISVLACTAQADEQKIYRQTLSEFQLSTIRAEVRQHFNVQDVVEFGRISAAKQPRNETLVCGCINIKSELSGCSGMTPFHGVLRHDQFIVKPVYRPREMEEACLQSGIPFRDLLQ